MYDLILEELLKYIGKYYGECLEDACYNMEEMAQVICDVIDDNITEIIAESLERSLK